MSLRDWWWRHRHGGTSQGPSALAASEVEGRLEDIQRRLQLQGIQVRETRSELDQHLEEDEIGQRFSDVDRDQIEQEGPHAT